MRNYQPGMQNAIKQQQNQPYPSLSFNPSFSINPFSGNQPYPSFPFNASSLFNPSPFNPSSFDPSSFIQESVDPSFITPTTPSQSSSSINPSQSLTPSNYSGLLASSNVHLHSKYQQTKKKFNLNNPSKTLRNPHHYHALFMKKGQGDDFKQAITKDYTQNLLNNLMETPDFKIWAKNHEDVRHDKGFLKMVNEEDKFKKDFDIFISLGISDINDEDTREVLGFQDGKFNNFQICNCLTKNDIKQLGILYDSFLHHQLWGMHEWQQQHLTKNKSTDNDDNKQQKEGSKIIHKNPALAALGCSVFTHMWHKILIHLGFEQELDKSYNFAGMIIPIDEEFYTNEDLSETDFIMVRQHPFSLMGPNQWKETAQTKKTVGNSSCFIDALLYPTNYMCYTQCISQFSDGIRAKTLKYWGCRDCALGKPHLSFPWQPFIPGLPSRYNVSGSRTTWTTLIDEWQTQAEHNSIIQKLLGYYYVSMFVIAHKTMIHSNNDVVKTELCNASHRLQTRYEFLRYFNINECELKCDDEDEIGYDFEECNKDSSGLFINKHYQQIASYKQRSIYVRMTSEIGIPFPTNEFNFFIKGANNRNEASTKTLFVTQTDLDKLSLHQVKHSPRLVHHFYHLLHITHLFASFITSTLLVPSFLSFQRNIQDIFSYHLLTFSFCF